MMPFTIRKKGLTFAGEPGGKAMFQEELQQGSRLEERMVRVSSSRHHI